MCMCYIKEESATNRLHQSQAEEYIMASNKIGSTKSIFHNAQYYVTWFTYNAVVQCKKKNKQKKTMFIYRVGSARRVGQCK